MPAALLVAIDAKARRAGLSRTEYIRRTLAREGSDITRDVSVEDLRKFAHTFANLDDPDVMRHAWS